MSIIIRNNLRGINKLIEDYKEGKITKNPEDNPNKKGTYIDFNKKNKK